MAETTPPLLPQMLDQWQSTLGWQPTEAQQQLFQRLYQTIVITNQSFNLTRITEPNDFWEKHLWDSLRGIQAWLTTDPKSLSLVDIGTGAGLPGLPIAIVKPDWQLTLVDSTRKKVKFVQQTAEDLELKGVNALSDRAEQLGHSKYYRAQYDLATIRAVSKPSVCAEYVLPLLKVGGTAILYRGQWTDEDAQACERAMAELGGKVDRVETFETPLTNGARSCAYLKKITPTSTDYPRAVGLPTQKPL
ncbi:16S rRNA (guanine(527)-N(7))-methyltransferase RsmG [filamentous cyanobacterium LEGE 11480]|uniref:Ribosomal RNA small subunit methyltransferase G n=1 Tax=Romeriopsis navalis LEGE 11480 TaxID=2777977 RepID=A0A928VP29_9CYAN|nr:16S rRNA (guanine(527)-N(7))-methyltransferase RsmG [Romeriopsis navalis]MBE9030266.1 16S rRNA (guanine(527)-N(7))-methyltransferase RsmG [Romeriopsis navalis LEGE 11480]